MREQRQAEAAVRAAQLARLARDLRLVQQQRAAGAALEAIGAIVDIACTAIASAFQLAFAGLARRCQPVMDPVAAAHAADPELMHVWGGMGAGECSYCPVHRAQHAAGPVAFHERHGVGAGRCWWCQEARVCPEPLDAAPRGGRA